MVLSSVVKYSKLEKTLWMGADYYKPLFLNFDKKLENFKLVSLSEIAFITDGSHEIRNYVKRGILFLRVQDIKEGFIEIKDPVYISYEEHRALRRSQLKSGDVVITKTGTVGIAAVVTPDIKEANIPADVAKIRIKDRNINPYFLAIFLNSKYGRYQIFRQFSGTRPRIILDNLHKIKIPILHHDFQLFIERLVKQAYEKRKLAEQKYKQAESLLYKILKVSEEEIEKLEQEKTYETSFRNVQQALRLDAEFHHPKLNIISLLLNKGVELYRLWDLIVSIETGKNIENSEVYKDKGIRFIKNENLQEIYISGKEYYLPPYIKIPTDKLTKEGDIIISRVGSIGNCSIITREYEGSYYSDNVYRIRVSEEIDPWFLVFYLRSVFGKSQVLRLSKGTNQPLISHETFKHMLVPKLSKEKQREISKLVKEYFELRKESRALIQQAIKEVEEAIENASSAD